MTAPPRRRSARLLRWYPEEWRTRYGDEFVELLAADIEERPRSWTRTVDVAVGAIMARSADWGLSGHTLDPSARPRRSLATLGAALAVLATLALSMWSQLRIAQRWAAPADVVTRRAIVVMSVAVVACVATTMLSVVVFASDAALSAVRRPELGLRRPLALFACSTLVLVVGGVVFRDGWAGAGAWSHQVGGPGGLAGCLWASTIAVSAYWFHPATLLRLPTAEITWMVADLLAIMLAATGAARTLRRIDLTSGPARLVAVTARIAILGFALFATGMLIWLFEGTPGPRNAFQAGAVDVIGLAVTIVALAVAAVAVQRASAPVPRSSQAG